MAKTFLKCYNCKEDFRREELVTYTPLRAKTSHNYCPKCYQEKLAREKFSEKVCAIFGIKSPGARIWTERKRLIDTYGYTDQILIDCLDYIYNVEKKKKWSESLCLINPTLVEKMLAYKRKGQYQNNLIVNAINTPTKEYIVPIKENTIKHNNKWDMNDLIFD